MVFLALFIAMTSSGQAPPPGDSPALVCQFNPLVADLLALTHSADWAGWIAQLSGAAPVIIDGQTTRIQTRYSPTMFDPKGKPLAYNFVLEQLRLWYPHALIEEDPYSFDGSTWKNLILEIPGALHPERVLVLSAHLDSISEDPTVSAPGASDNGSGSAALLEAARILRFYRFENSLRLIFFTGEEQGLIGSKAYVRDHNLHGILGDINLDMFGFDQDNDRCFELHVGTMVESAPLGQCFRSALQEYQPELRVDYLNGYDLRFSDHSSFWDMRIGALEVLENYSYNGSQNGCLGTRDRNPNYHRTSDTLDKINLATGFAIVRSAIATAAGLAHPQAACFAASPTLSLATSPGEIHLAWSAVAGAENYQVLRSSHGCSSGWERLSSAIVSNASDRQVRPGQIYSYQIEALNEAGACTSIPSPCVSASPPFQRSQRQAPAIAR